MVGLSREALERGRVGSPPERNASGLGLNIVIVMFEFPHSSKECHIIHHASDNWDEGDASIQYPPQPTNDVYPGT